MRRVSAVLSGTIGLVAPLALSVIWVPIRADLPNTALALVLVLCVVAIGSFGDRVAITVAAGSAGLSFDFFDTRPFQHVDIAGWLDLETTIALVVVSAVGGELAVRVVRARRRASSQSARAASISSAASLLADGAELALVIQAVGEELSTLLGLSCWEFAAGPGDDDMATLERDGSIRSRRPLDLLDRGLAREPVALPVWGHAQVLGRYLLRWPEGSRPPSRDDVCTAMTLADQVGAAFMTQAPPPPDPALDPAPNLHVVR